jgi:NAD(P)-dependent dehydrogenase (short-subunit alcohol dehydrogenase family)
LCCRTSARWRKIIDVNLMSEIFAARHAIPHMLEQGSDTCSTRRSWRARRTPPEGRDAITTEQLADIVKASTRTTHSAAPTHFVEAAGLRRADL